jgi:hypothetical protein
LPFKTFSDGETLTARDVNTFMMSQQVMVFDNAADRNEAIVDPIHGMFAYLRDVNRISFFNGSVWRLI